MLDDLQRLDDTSRPSNHAGGAARKIAEQLKPTGHGTLLLSIEGQTLELDPRPSDSNPGFTPFFAALDRAVAKLASPTPALNPESHLGILLAAQKHGDLDLSGSRLLREADPTFTDERKVYLLKGLAAMLKPASLQPNARVPRVQGEETGECERRKHLVAPSLLPFKRGELDGLHAKLKAQVELGFRRVALFHAVHYAGGAYSSSGTSAWTRVPEHPKRGQDYRFESLNAPTSGELERAVKTIIDSGLELSYLPHLESIRTMNSEGEAEWRIYSAIPLDDPELFERMYAPVVKVLNENAGSLVGTPTISIAAELDRSTFFYPDAALRLVDKLEAALRLPRSKYAIEWNPNGDFFALGHLASTHKARGIEGCKDIETLLLTKVDGIGPSMYDQYANIEPPSGDPDFEKTRAGFLGGLRDYVEGECPGVGNRTESRFRDRFSIGEFSLQGPRASRYRTFLESALKVSRGIFGRVNMWSSNEAVFDPLARPGGAPETKSQAEQDIEAFRHC